MKNLLFVLLSITLISSVSCKKDVGKYPYGLPWNQIAPTVEILNKPANYSINTYYSVPANYVIKTSCSDQDDRVIEYKLSINGIRVDSLSGNNINFTARQFNMSPYPPGYYTLNVSTKDQRGNYGGDAFRIYKQPQ